MSQMRMSISALLVSVAVITIVSAILPPTSAFAQDIGPALDPGLMTGWTGGAAVQYDLEKRAAAARGSHSSAHNQTASKNLSFHYVPTTKAKQKALTAFLAPISASDPAGAQTIATQFKLHDVDTIYRSLVSGTGLKDNDVADALTAYVLVNWMIANDIKSDLPPAQVRAARKQVASLLASKPQLRSSATRAVMGEEYKYMLVTIHAGWQSAKREGNLKQYADGITQRFQGQSGQNLRALKITTTGFGK